MTNIPLKNPKALDEILISRNEKTVVIDALFGSGLNRKIEGFVAEVINKINEFHVISVDIASGLFADKYTEKGAIIKPKRTISFQLPKLAFFHLKILNLLEFGKLLTSGFPKNIF